MIYYSTIKKNKIMSFAAIQTDIDSVILSEVSQTEGEISYHIPHIWNQKKRMDTKELT